MKWKRSVWPTRSNSILPCISVHADAPDFGIVGISSGAILIELAPLRGVNDRGCVAKGRDTVAKNAKSGSDRQSPLLIASHYRHSIFEDFVDKPFDATIAQRSIDAEPSRSKES
jgi:hypothetical protein